MTSLAERYTFGDREHVALRLIPCVASQVVREPESGVRVGKYISRGFALVFWRRTGAPEDDGKAPREPGWPTKTYDAADLREGMQVGVKLGVEIAPGHFLGDCDFDWAPGIPYVRRFLPKTGFVFGRKSKPFGHAFYTTSSPIVTVKYKDVDGTTLAEWRGTKADGSIGLQTMLPPSRHYASGEDVVLATDGELSHDDVAPLGLCLYVVACLLGRHWPKNGPDTNQHDTAGYAAGFLCARGVDPTRVVDIIEVAATLGGDDNVHDRVLYAQDTIKKSLAGETRLTGGPRLAQELGDPVVTRLRQWLPLADPLAGAIEKLNERFAIVSVGNRVVVMESRPDGGIRDLWPFEEFKHLLIKEVIWIGDKEVALAGVWLKHKDGRRYDRLVYAMPGSAQQAEPTDYNAYLGFTVAPLSGDWSKNRDHLRRIVCGGDERNFAWVMSWCAALVQQPGRHAMSALVLRGGQGVGKGHFANLMLGALFHPQQYLHILGAGMLTGRFNEHLSGKVLVFADESTWGGDPEAANKLKGMVTESTVPIERKFLPLVEEPSALHIVIASNNEWPISIPPDDRRFMVLDVAETERQNDQYFGPLREELRSGGLAAMLFDLLAYRVDDHALRHPPSTKAKREIMMQSLKPIERWWFEHLADGSLNVQVVTSDDKTNLLSAWGRSVPKGALHSDYLNFLDRHRETRARRSTETELGMFLAKYTPLHSQRRLPETGTKAKRGWVWDIPSLEECRELWARVCGYPEDFRWDELD